MLVALFSTATSYAQRVSPTEDKSQFVNLTDAVPDAILEIRYFGTYNFVGDRIDGVLEPTALLTRRAADSLRAVSDDVKALGFRLKIYDAYRPQRGVNHFVRWAANIPDTRMKQYFYPDQYNNDANWKAHSEGTAAEIWEQTDHRVTHFAAGTGTSGTFMGTTRGLKHFNPEIKSVISGRGHTRSKTARR